RPPPYFVADEFVRFCLQIDFDYIIICISLIEWPSTNGGPEELAPLSTRRLETEIKLTCDLNQFMSPTVDLPPKLTDYLNETRAPLPPVTDPDQPLQIDSLGLIRL